MTPLNTPKPSTWRFWALPGRQSLAPHWSLAPLARSSQGEAVDVVDLVWEVLLPLLGQEAEACAADDPVHHVQGAAHAAVHVVQDDALLGHVVLDDNNAIGAQAPLAAPQELGQMLIGQVAWGKQRLSPGRGRPSEDQGHAGPLAQPVSGWVLRGSVIGAFKTPRRMCQDPSPPSV